MDSDTAKIIMKHTDWRHQAVGILSKPFNSPTGKIFSEGSVVTPGVGVNYFKNILSFVIPNATAIFLDISIKQFNQANSYISHFDPKKNSNLSFLNSENTFHCLESIIASIVFSYCALEAFANEFIPEDYIFKITRTDQKCIEHYNKEQIERFLSLDVKLSQVLPEIFKIKSPKGKSIWNHYVNHKKLRDRIIHLKSDDRNDAGPKADTIWKHFFAQGIPNTSNTAKEMINYFLTNYENKPHWFKNYPY